MMMMTTMTKMATAWFTARCDLPQQVGVQRKR